MGNTNHIKTIELPITFFAGNYISNLFIKYLSPDLLFHNLSHTINVVRGVREIASHTFLSKAECEILSLAAWFHDSGHILCYKEHEEKSQLIAQNFLIQNQYPKSKIEQVLACIAITKMPQEPQNLLEKIICDADLYHLSQIEYPQIQQLLREEWRRVLKKEFSDEAWKEENLTFLQNHQYFTEYGQKVLQVQKQESVLKLCLC